jgi:hypothetical protein
MAWARLGLEAMSSGQILDPSSRQIDRICEWVGFKGGGKGNIDTKLRSIYGDEGDIYTKLLCCWASVVQAYHPSYWGGRDQDD